MQSSDTTQTYQGVLAGMGTALLPGWLVDDDLAARRLLFVDSERAAFSSTLFAVYASCRQMPPKLHSFFDFLSVRLNV